MEEMEIAEKGACDIMSHITSLLEDAQQELEIRQGHPMYETGAPQGVGVHKDNAAPRSGRFRAEALRAKGLQVWMASQTQKKLSRLRSDHNSNSHQAPTAKSPTPELGEQVTFYESPEVLRQQQKMAKAVEDFVNVNAMLTNMKKLQEVRDYKLNLDESSAGPPEK
ncbi:hypothetical protein CYMTET_27725 [Cymbomonas tetramitiformis]|uniref:Uncharacterized protein n=1 Tax=Cymbomonas tetramitiformis TaxID=36881 RepID=A0AAE0FPA3_9CHLO|nr:hypothetical protein CYMTET_27725 [Cymbomonas tetramitiformis]